MLRCLLPIVLIAITFMCRATDRALLVGIGPYDRPATGWSAVHGDDDVALLRPLFERQGFADVVTLTNARATKAAIVGALADLAGRCREGDRVFFLFSGHGQPVRDDNDDEGPDKKYDEAVVPYDACRDTRKMHGTYAGQYHLIDDELNRLLDAIKRAVAPGGELFVAVDACYSRGIEKDEITDLDPDLLRCLRGTNYAFNPPVRLTHAAPSDFTPGAVLTVVTACRENERNFEYKAPTGRMYGSLSYYISTLLTADADFERWRRCFNGEAYRPLNIFQTFQHPSIEVFP